MRSLTAELMAQPLDQFTARRNARAKELKASGQGDLARELGELKKPALPLWAANQVRDRALLSGLRQAAQSVARAPGGGRAGGPRSVPGPGAPAASGRANAAQDLRAASEEFQRNIESVATA